MLLLLSQGLNGAAIAARLHLSPETVRTHVRNAMTKLGASTRSQAVVLALRHGEIDTESGLTPDSGARRANLPTGDGEGHGSTDASGGTAVQPPPTLRARGLDADLSSVVQGLTSLYEVEGGAIFLVDHGGLTLRRVAYSDPNRAAGSLEESLTLGQGPIGTVATGYRARVVPLPQAGSSLALAVAPARTEQRLVGLLCLTMRPSRPLGRTELLLLQAFASQLAEVLDGEGEGVGERLAEAMERFRASWTGR